MSDNPENPPDFMPPASPQEIPAPIIVTEVNPSLFSKVIQIIGTGCLCLECLGRQFSYLGTATDNTTRASSLLLSLIMECHTLLLKTTPTVKFRLFNQSPLMILTQIADRTAYKPAIELVRKLTQEHPEIFEIEECITVIDLFKNISSSKSDDLYNFALNPKFECRLCHNWLLPKKIEELAELIVETARGYDFASFLVGSLVPSAIINREEEFRAGFDLQNGESFKANINRLVGKQLYQWWTKPVESQNPDILYLIDLTMPVPRILIQASSLYVKGIYRKYVRNLPQTRWDCPICHGLKINPLTNNSCEKCQGTGKLMPDSIEELLTPFFLEETMGSEMIFHGAGREDYDVKCIGSGRPFVVEVKSPIRRILNLANLCQKINQKVTGRLEIFDLMPSNRKDVNSYKEHFEQATKVYLLLVEFGEYLDADLFNQKLQDIQRKLVNKTIDQRTPLRVVHRRADKTRKKQVYSIEGHFVDGAHALLKVCAEGGMYIKEFIHGDNGRTYPSLSDLFQFPVMCVELDVVEIKHPTLRKEV